MARILIFVFLLPAVCFAQTNTVNSGNWTDGSVWSTGAQPLTTATVNANHPVVINTNITVTTGTYNFFQNVTDLPGGTAYTLTMTTVGGTLDIKAGVTTFEGSALFDDVTVFVRSGATLILGATQVNNQSDVTIEAGGTLIINGNLTNNNNGIGTFVINGLVQVNGNYSAPVGNVDLSGTGDFFVTGTISTTGSSDVFGSTNDCTSGPCSGRNLCSFSNTIAANQTICSSGTPTGLTGNAVASPTYAWESSTTSATSGYGSTIATTQNFSPGSLTQNTWYRRKATSGGCTGISYPVAITVLPATGGWKGTTNDWNLNTNWCSNTVPSSTTDVSISTGVANMPQITAASNCRDLIINPGASVTINGSNTLSIFGNLTNNGSFSTNTSTVTMSGSTQQTISGSPINFNNLTINNSSGSSPQVTINSFVTVLSTFTMTLGNINLSAFNLTLGQSAASPGTLSYTAGRLYNGDFTRWFNTPTIAVGNVAGLFPVGSAADYRPLYVGNGGLSAGGTIKVGHTSSAGSTAVSPTFVDNGGTVLLRSNSFWKVSTANGLGTGTHSMRTEGTGFGTVSDVNHLRQTLVNSISPGSDGAHAGTTSNPQVNRTGLTTANLTNNFYWGSTNITTPLPVTLISFTGKLVEEGVHLSWTTVSQENFDYFELQRSSDGKEYQPIHQLPAEAYSTSIINYEFTDREVKNGKHYYRLKNVDRDRSFEFSNVILVEINKSKSVSIYPNPIEINSSLNIDINGTLDTTALAIIYNATGKLVGRMDLRNGNNNIETNELAAGIYLIRVSIGLEHFTSRLLVK